MGTGGPFPGAKARPERNADHSAHLVPRSRMSRSYTSSPPSASVACIGTALAFSIINTHALRISLRRSALDRSLLDFGIN
jgi:hypothetical protein